MTMPPKEWATNTVGPCCRASTSWVASTLALSVVNGFCTAVTAIPFGCSRAITSDQHDPSAKSPCTRTTFRTFGTGCAWAARCTSGLAAPATSMLTKVRRSIGCSCSVAGLNHIKLTPHGPSMEKNSIVGGERMDVANGDRGWLGWSNRVVRGRNRRRPQKPFEPGRREHNEIVILDLAGIAQLVGDVARGGETFAWPERGDLVSDDHLQFSRQHIIGLVLARMRMARHHHSRGETNLQQAVRSTGIGARQPYGTDAHVEVVALGSRLTVDRGASGNEGWNTRHECLLPCAAL